MSRIEGLEHLEKDGWELVRVGAPLRGVDWIVNANGQVAPCNFETTLLNWLIIRKKPKQYRPFANAAEFEPHRDRWIQRSDVRDTKETLPAGCFSVCSYNDHHIWTLDGKSVSYEQMFLDGKTFDDGSPFGVEVTT